MIPNPTITYPPNNTTGTLTFTPVPFTSGSATITVTVMDNGGTANGGVDITQQTFTIEVLPVNQAPTLNPIPNPATLLQNATLQTVSLSGITAGTGDGSQTQTLTVTATSSNTNLIPNPTVNYTSPNATGSLSFTPVTNASGTAMITVTVMDNGGVTNGGVNIIQQTFFVTVAAVNQPPTLAMISNPAPILENAGQQTVSVSGISDGDNGTQTLTVTASSSNPGLIPNTGTGALAVIFSDSHQTNQTATLNFTPVANVSGSAVITVTVNDHGSTANGAINTVFQSFTVTVLPVNQGVSFNTISPVNIAENAGQQTVNLTGISNGAGNPASTLSITATSSNTALILNPNTGTGALAVTYTSPNATGTLTFTPATGASGTATITVTLTNGGSTANGGSNSAIQTFTVTVTHVNQPPTLNPISNPNNSSNPNNFTILENSTTPQTASLTGIADGASDVGQSLTVTASSSNTSLIPTPTVNYTSPNQFGSVSFTPANDAVGTATITVTVSDGGVNNNSVSQSFQVTITPVNQQPSFASTITVTNGGSGYSSSSPPAVTIGAPASGGTQETATASVNSAGVVTGITITNPGSGYTSAPPVTIAAPGGSGTQATATSNPPAVNEGSGSQTVLNFALFNPGGGSNEASQTATYIITTLSNPNLFDVNPAISPTGTLTYTPAPMTAGTSTFTVEVEDSGGTADGGVNLSVPQTFTITVNAVNQAPSFLKGPNETVPENSAAQSVTGWATNISPGPPSQAGETVNFLVSDNDPALFSVQPAISPSGTLTYTPAPGTSGTATVTVDLQNSGSTANGGVNTSAPQIFTITVSPVVATPQVVPMAPVSFIQGGTAGNVVVAMFSEVNGGPASDFSATINWGDGTPPTAGIVSQDSVATATAPATYSVLGSHVYTSSGAFTITVSIVDHNGGSPVTASNTAVANSTASLLTAQLSPASDSGPSNSDGVTNITTPTITGTTLPGAQLTLVAQSSNGTTSTVATGSAGVDGSFQLTSSSLADGTYNFIVTSVPITAGSPTATFTVGPVVIDTVAPRVASVTLNPKTGQILITFTDVGDGLYLPSLTNRLSYLLAGKVTNVTAISMPSGSVHQETVALTLAHGKKKLTNGTIVLTLDAQGVNVIDQAGNTLAPTFISSPATGNSVPVGPLSAKFTIKNGKVVVPKPKKKTGPKIKSLSLPAGPLQHAHGIR